MLAVSDCFWLSFGLVWLVLDGSDVCGLQPVRNYHVWQNEVFLSFSEIQKHFRFQFEFSVFSLSDY